MEGTKNFFFTMPLELWKKMKEEIEGTQTPISVYIRKSIEEKIERDRNELHKKCERGDKRK